MLTAKEIVYFGYMHTSHQPSYLKKVFFPFYLHSINLNLAVSSHAWLESARLNSMGDIAITNGEGSHIFSTHLSAPRKRLKHPCVDVC